MPSRLESTLLQQVFEMISMKFTELGDRNENHNWYSEKPANEIFNVLCLFHIYSLIMFSINNQLLIKFCVALTNLLLSNKHIQNMMLIVFMWNMQ